MANAEYNREYYKRNAAAITATAVEWQQTNKERHNEAVARYARRRPDITKAASTKYRNKNKGTIPYVQRAMISRAKIRAAKQGYPFSIAVKDIQDVWPKDNTCPVLGIPFDISGTDIQRCASLDKIVPELGYVPGNILVISYRANSIKQDATISELSMVLEYFSRLSL